VQVQLISFGGIKLGLRVFWGGVIDGDMLGFSDIFSLFVNVELLLRGFAE
jgi:hypothetical protein